MFHLVELFFQGYPAAQHFVFRVCDSFFLASGALHSRYSRTAEAPRRRWRFSAELQDRTATEFISKCYTASWEACAQPAQSTTSHWTMLPLQLRMLSWGYLGVTAVFVIGFSVAIFPFFPHFSWHSFLDAPRPGIWTNMHSMNSMHWCCVLPFVGSFLILVDSFHLTFCDKLPSEKKSFASPITWSRHRGSTGSS